MSRIVQDFDPLAIPIAGTNLIEASAGTGKTYGIAALFTRFILLEHYAIDRILVVTFTKAATAELKYRLRARLDEALRWLEKDEAHKPVIDEFMQNLLAQAQEKESTERLILRLKAALSQFDNAAIYTIHGFCQRLLRDYAFLCQVPFDVELSEHNREHLAAPAQDFWRTQIAHDATWAGLVFRYQQTPETMLAEMGQYLARPDLAYRAPNADAIKHAQHALNTTWQRVCSQLTELEAAFWALMDSALSGTYYKKNTFQPLFQQLHTAAEQNRLPDMPSGKKEQQDFLHRLSLLHPESLQNKSKKGKTPDAALCAQLSLLAELGEHLAAAQAAEQEALAALQLNFLHHLSQAAQDLKKTHHERGFDDLLLDVYQALATSPYRHELAATVAQNWQIALIDEFQDTDPLQYDIFRRTFIAHNNPLFLVGDPKQAIYSFRGADIYAYLQAADDAINHYTLTHNYRSHAKLINSISYLFQQKERPFVLDDIGYPPVEAARADSLLSPARHAVQIRWLNQNDESGLNKETLRRRAAEYCADEIAHVLNQAAQAQLMLNQRPLQPNDIAVLVRTHNEGLLVSRSLKQRHIQSVLIQRESVFTTAEAQALAALLGFWLEPQRTEPLRFILGGILFQQTAAQLYELNHNEALLSDYIMAAENALQTWQQYGIYTAIQQFFARYQIEARLLATQNERSLTNLLQLAELLATEHEQSHSPSALLHWFHNQIQASHNGSEGNILRLESDEALVKIVTMHASKGLQYPLVYCPFAWDAPEKHANDWQILHRHGAPNELLAAYQLSEADQHQLADEELGERLRLLYVALTRAEEQLTLYAAHFNQERRSYTLNPFAYLLEGNVQHTRLHIEQSYQAERKANKSAGEQTMLFNNWQRFIQHAPNSTDMVFLTEAPISAANQNRSREHQHYRAHELPERRFQFIRHTSFTGLTRNLSHYHATEDETLDTSEAQATAIPTPEDNPYSIHHLPAGAKTGLCLHELLEHLDFTQPADSQLERLEPILNKHGFGIEWLPAIQTMLDLTAHTPLTNQQALADIPATHRLPEMGFLMHMQHFQLTRLKQQLAQAHLPEVCLQAAKQLDFHTVQGFLNGFIDMLCIDQHGQVSVIDYKSNYLGSDPTAYHTDALNQAIADHHYYLQAWIYAIAVARHFAQRQQPLQTIHIRYLFLRGLDGTDNGVWSWDIDVQHLAEWL